ncbi:MAG: FHA domain-containing protein [Myxococcales bacterium]|nr:FHA domain-containing protein [Myxococcales bacterium]
MNCPSCKRPNAEGIDFCDYCGTPLASAPAGKRKTEMEGGPAPKHKTEIAADPLDPFAPRHGASPPKPPPVSPAHVQGGAAGGGDKPKYKTVFDGGASAPKDPSDPFAPVDPAKKKAADKNAGKRIVGFLVSFDRSAEGNYWVIREGRNTIGRDEECDIVIEGDEMVSSTHAVLLWRNGRTIVDDEKSQNGTFLNEADVMEKTDVKDGDVIRLGRTNLMCRLLDQAKVSALWKPA